MQKEILDMVWEKIIKIIVLKILKTDGKSWLKTTKIILQHLHSLTF